MCCNVRDSCVTVDADSVQFEIAHDLRPHDRTVASAMQDCKDKLGLHPVGFVKETGKEYLRPPTPVTRDLYGAGSMYSWGGGDLGCLGHGETDTMVYPKCIDALRGRQVRAFSIRCMSSTSSRTHSGVAVLQIADFACGVGHVVALTSTGEAFTWGDNREFQCGMGLGHPFVSRNITQPMRIPSLIGKRVVAVACGAGHSIVITATGEVFAWGAGNEGQLGLGTPDVHVVVLCSRNACVHVSLDRLL